MPRVINEAWVAVCIQPDGEEGVPGFVDKGHVLPLFWTRAGNTQEFSAIAEQIAKNLGKEIQIRKFTSMEVVEIHKPRVNG